ncbi:hypothetical protein QUB52_02900 [Microcoleus sp. A6-C6]
MDSLAGVFHQSRPIVTTGDRPLQVLAPFPVARHSQTGIEHWLGSGNTRPAFPSPPSLHPTAVLHPQPG